VTYIYPYNGSVYQCGCPGCPGRTTYLTSTLPTYTLPVPYAPKHRKPGPAR